jgi:hypothetical protein
VNCKFLSTTNEVAACRKVVAELGLAYERRSDGDANFFCLKAMVPEQKMGREYTGKERMKFWTRVYCCAKQDLQSKVMVDLSIKDLGTENAEQTAPAPVQSFQW